MRSVADKHKLLVQEMIRFLRKNFIKWKIQCHETFDAEAIDGKKEEEERIKTIKSHNKCVLVILFAAFVWISLQYSQDKLNGSFLFLSFYFIKNSTQYGKYASDWTIAFIIGIEK